MGKPRKRMTYQQRFDGLYVPEPNTGCWLWLGRTIPSGYGMMSKGSDAAGDKRPVYAHRMSWELHHGPIPDGLFVCHKCDVRGCVNPQHLFLGTVQDNSDDMVRKGRQTLGERNPMAKLTEDDVREIRKAKKAGETYTSISRRFNVHPIHAHYIVRRKLWRHVV